MTAWLTPWDSAGGPDRGAIAARFRAEGLTPSAWANGPGDRYARHSATVGAGGVECLEATR